MTIKRYAVVSSLRGLDYCAESTRPEADKLILPMAINRANQLTDDPKEAGAMIRVHPQVKVDGRWETLQETVYSVRA